MVLTIERFKFAYDRWSSLERVQIIGFKMECELPVTTSTSKWMEYEPRKRDHPLQDIGNRFVVVTSKHHGRHVVQHDVSKSKNQHDFEGISRIGRRKKILKGTTSSITKVLKTATLISHNKGSDYQLVECLNHLQDEKSEKASDNRRTSSDTILITTKIFVTPGGKNVAKRGRNVLYQGDCQTNKQSGDFKERKVDGSLPDRDQLVQIWGESHVSFSERCQIVEWDKVSGSNFFVRHGPNYVRNRRKVASKESLYYPVYVCAFQTRTRRKKSSLLDMMPLSYSEAFPNGSLPDLKDERVPHLLVINIQVPFEHTSVLSKAKDGKGGDISFCFVPSNRFCNESNSLLASTNTEGKIGSSSDAATRLFTEWCEHCRKSRDWRAKLKCMGTVHDVDGINPFKSYKGKPVMIGDSSSIFKGVTDGGVRYLEVSINGMLMKWILNDHF